MKVFSFRPVLMTAESIKLQSWKNTEWFGVNFPYVPYWDANEEHLAYGIHDGDILKLDVDEDFDFLAIFLAGEFVCSMEFGELLDAPCSIAIRNISFISQQESLKNAFCPSQ